MVSESPGWKWMVSLGWSQSGRRASDYDVYAGNEKKAVR
jgi:hypothetical protein